MKLEYAPCMNQIQRSWGPVVSKHPGETQTGGCTPIKLTKEKSLTKDPRYKRISDVAFNELEIQEDSGVLQILEGLTGYANYVPNLAEKKFSFNYAWTRPTISWRLACETEGSFTRQEAHRRFKDDVVDLGALDQANLLYKYGVWILVFAFLGPFLGFITYKTKQYRDRPWGRHVGVDTDNFIKWFGIGFSLGYLGLLVLSVLVVEKVDDAVQKMTEN